MQDNLVEAHTADRIYSAHFFSLTYVHVMHVCVLPYTNFISLTQKLLLSIFTDKETKGQTDYNVQVCKTLPSTCFIESVFSVPISQNMHGLLIYFLNLQINFYKFTEWQLWWFSLVSMQVCTQTSQSQLILSHHYRNTRVNQLFRYKFLNKL